MKIGHLEGMPQPDPIGGLTMGWSSKWDVRGARRNSSFRNCRNLRLIIPRSAGWFGKSNQEKFESDFGLHASARDAGWWILVGGFKDVLCSSLPGKMIQFTNIFQMGWNHQLVDFFVLFWNMFWTGDFDVGVSLTIFVAIRWGFRFQHWC